jgi:hypothetical protein
VTWMVKLQKETWREGFMDEEGGWVVSAIRR